LNSDSTTKQLTLSQNPDKEITHGTLLFILLSSESQQIQGFEFHNISDFLSEISVLNFKFLTIYLCYKEKRNQQQTDVHLRLPTQVSSGLILFTFIEKEMWPTLVTQVPVNFAESMAYNHFSTRVTEKHDNGME
jgi:hypothetical protein